MAPLEQKRTLNFSTVKSLKFVVAQFSWDSWMPYSTNLHPRLKQNLKKLIFLLLKTENRPITSPRISNKSTFNENSPPEFK